MSLKETIDKKFIEEFKTKIAIRRYPYEVVKQRILVAEKSGQYDLPLTDDQIVNLIAKEVKEREDLLTVYKETDEQYVLAKYIIGELSQYLPKQMSEEEVIELIKTVKQTESNDGKVIGMVVRAVGNRFDKSKIAKLVKQV